MTTQELQSGFQEFALPNQGMMQGDDGADFQDWVPTQKDVETPSQKKSKELAERENSLSQKEANLQQKEQELLQMQNGLNDILQRVQGFVAAFEEKKKQFWENNTAEIVSFARQLVEKIIQKKLEEDPSILTNQIKSALEELEIDHVVDVHMSPEDYEFLKSANLEEVQKLFALEKVKWIADMRLSRGEVFVDTEQFRLDASLATVIKNMEQNLMQERAHQPANMQKQEEVVEDSELQASAEETPENASEPEQSEPDAGSDSDPSDDEEGQS
ncbi:MAG: hypothetical protein H7A33_07075 [Deltaproteobacteria bacterium]|nr:hypothetical protein [Deltaproteobacteria bacterium]